MTSAPTSSRFSDEPVSASVSAPSLTILIPIYNDWTAAELLVAQIDSAFGERSLRGQVVFIDDGSLEPMPEQFPRALPSNISQIDDVELRTNLGHQRALCVGLVHLSQTNQTGPVVVMDGDGEDAPSDIYRLLETFLREKPPKVVFAGRRLRPEGLVFKVFYHAYRTIHRLVVGFDPRFGNFSVLPASILQKLVVSSDLWNHYAAAVVKMKLPYKTVPTDRSRRFAGESKMGFVGLVVHGLSAMSVFGDTVGVRLLISCGLAALVTIALIIAALTIRLTTDLAIPGWATYVSALLLLILSQLAVLSLVFIFVALYSRGQSSFVPLRDCPIYIGRVRTLFRRHE